jgi:FtsH-binding integral membrane protein
LKGKQNMSFDDNRSLNRAAYGSDIDAGLQAFMRRVYNLMGLGLAVTGLTAWVVAATPALTHFFLEKPMAWVVLFAPFLFLMFGFTPQRIARTDAGTATMIFVAFSMVIGLSTAGVFLAYTHESIARVFFITAGAFAATSLYGYTTKRSLTGVGSFMFMGLAGIVIAGFVNILFLHSSALYFATSVLGIAIFTGLTAWETQMLKEMYRQGDDASNNALAIRGALGLYLDFINLFMSLIRLMGDRR